MAVINGVREYWGEEEKFSLGNLRSLRITSLSEGHSKGELGCERIEESRYGEPVWSRLHQQGRTVWMSLLHPQQNSVRSEKGFVLEEQILTQVLFRGS